MVGYVLRCAKPCNNSNGIAYSNHWASGDWTPMGGPSTDFTTPLFPAPGTGRAEDPFLYVDSNGSCHALMHDQGRSYGALGETGSGGHAYSMDCRTWTYGVDAAFTTTVQHTDGTSSTYMKRERPKLAFDRGMNPIALFTGTQDILQNNPIPPHCTWANHRNISLNGYCDPSFTHVQRIAHT